GDALTHPRAQSFERPAFPRDADDRDIEVAPPLDRLQGGEDLLIRQVPGRAEDDEGVAAGFVGCHDRPPEDSWWPPNCRRSADSRRFEKSSSCRELNRWNSAVVSTGAGAELSMAASAVHRPSPESETRPENG